MSKNKTLRAVLFILASELLGSIGTIATTPATKSWYPLINKPEFNPPNWVFGPVWTILFALMGYSSFLIFEKGWKKEKVRLALKLFAIQFALNILWSFIFFGMQLYLTAFAEIVVLWVAILIVSVKFYNIDKSAGLLLLPYLLWVTFAGILNLSIALLN